MAKNILICDDAAFMRMMIKDILTKNGYGIAGEAENGAVAVCSKAIGKNKAIGNIIKHLDTLTLDKNFPVYFVYSDDDTNSKLLKDKLVAAGYDVADSKLCNLGPTLGTHVGIGAYGVAYVIGK